MDTAWLVRNVSRAWRERASLRDFGKRILFTYAHRLPGVSEDREWSIGFRYPEPIGDVRFVLRANAGVDMFVHGEVFELQYYALELSKEPETILDLGANIGLTAVYFARAFPDARIACLEPVPRNFRLLVRNLKLNAVEAEAIEAAVDVVDGQAVMELDPLDYGHRVSERQADGEGFLSCPALSVPSIMRRLGWQRIGLLKVDIEGHEKVLFAGDCDWLLSVDAMCIECHPGFDDTDLQRLAGRYGFSPPRMLPGIWLMVRPDAAH